jgi:uncharacterized OB-fold protein
MRPDPIQRIDSAFFWKGCEEGKLLAQKFEGSDRLWHPPRPMCPITHTTKKTYVELSGKGTVISWAKQIRPASFGFADSPFVILVELEEGLRMLSNFESETPPEFGMAVEVDFAQTSGKKAVPIFRPAGA